jgi:integrase
MARTKSKERARERILSDDEIRLIWRQLSGTFGAFVKVLLLTGQRRSEVATMRRSEIDKDGVWIIPPEKYKTKRAQVVPLSKMVREIIEERSNDHDYVFSTRKETAFSAWGNAKKALDEAIAAARAAEAARERCKLDPMPPWTLHDLRRTAKTLMVRVGVRPDISERVLGHAIAGVEGVYDRHSYLDEKREALERLAAIVERILSPALADVVPLDERRQRGRA